MSQSSSDCGIFHSAKKIIFLVFIKNSSIFASIQASWIVKVYCLKTYFRKRFCIIIN